MQIACTLHLHPTPFPSLTSGSPLISLHNHMDLRDLKPVKILHTPYTPYGIFRDRTPHPILHDLQMSETTCTRAAHWLQYVLHLFITTEGNCASSYSLPHFQIDGSACAPSRRNSKPRILNPIPYSLPSPKLR